MTLHAPFRAPVAAVAAAWLAAQPLTVAQGSAYEAAQDWARLTPGMEWRTVTSASPDTDGNLYVFRRNEPPILRLTASGTFERSLGEKQFAAAHGIRVDRGREYLGG